MPLGLNLIDYIIIFALLFFAFEAYGRSLIAELLDLVSFLLAFSLSFAYYNFFAGVYENSFKTPHGLSLVLGFLSVWFLSEIIFFFLIRLVLTPLLKIKIPGEKFLSIIPALFRGLILIALLLVLMATFPIQPVVKKNIQESKIGSFLLQHAYRLEQPVKNVFGGVSNDTLTFLTIKPETDQRVDLGFQTQDIKVDAKLENAMIDLVNKERVDRGLSKLVYDEKLRDIGRGHSADMFRRGYFSHYSPENKSVADRANQAKLEYLIVGENLAYAPSLELAHQGLMNSPGHRANILSPEYNKIGIGVMDGGIYSLMFTQVFSD